MSLNYVLVHIVQTNLSFPAVVDPHFPRNADAKMPVQWERCPGTTGLVSSARPQRYPLNVTIGMQGRREGERALVQVNQELKLAAEAANAAAAAGQKRT